MMVMVIMFGNVNANYDDDKNTNDMTFKIKCTNFRDFHVRVAPPYPLFGLDAQK